MIQNVVFQENAAKLFNEILLNNKNIESLYILYNCTINPPEMLNLSSGIEFIPIIFDSMFHPR